MAVACLLVIAGCANPRLERSFNDRLSGPAYAPVNVDGDEFFNSQFIRVAVLPFARSSAASDFHSEIESTMLRELRESGRFELIEISEADLYTEFGEGRFPVSNGINGSLVDWLYANYQIDGILFTTITTFRPYKPMVLGIRSQLIDIRGNAILWTADEVFNAGRAEVAMGARKYSQKNLEQRFPLQSSYSALLSPQRFAAYCAHTTYATLPQRRRVR